MLRELRRVLVELRDKRWLASFMKGKNDIFDELLFPVVGRGDSGAEQPLSPLLSAGACEGRVTEDPTARSQAYNRLAADPEWGIDRLRERADGAQAQFRSPWTSTGT